MIPQTFILIGRSGCGKGTQAKFVQDYLKKTDPSRKTLCIQTGAEVREFIKGDLITQRLSRTIYDKGGLQPEFLMIFMWTNVLVEKYTTKEHLIMDGMPRKYHEAGVLNSIFSFYKLGKPHVIYIDISKEEAKKRLLARKRVDDTAEKIEERLGWFEVEVAKTLDFFKNNPDYDYVVVNGEQSPQDVYEEILNKTKLDLRD